MVSDPPFTNLIQVSDNNEYDALEDYEKEDIPGMVSDPSFANLVQGSDCNKKRMLIGTKFSTKRRITALCMRRPFMPSWLGEIWMF